MIRRVCKAEAGHSWWDVLRSLRGWAPLQLDESRNFGIGDETAGFTGKPAGQSQIILDGTFSGQRKGEHHRWNCRLRRWVHIAEPGHSWWDVLLSSRRGAPLWLDESGNFGIRDDTTGFAGGSTWQSQVILDGRFSSQCKEQRSSCRFLEVNLARMSLKW